MLLLISPAKSLDFESELATSQHTQSDFLPQSNELIKQAREMTPDEIGKLMGISEKLSELNHERFINWQTPFTPDNARQAVLAFQGDVYQGMQAETFSDADFEFAQQHLRILSGLYGLLRPLDLIQPYRLEMGLRFANNGGSNLYQFWGEQLTHAVNQQLETLNQNVVVNLASNEYYKAIKPKLLNGEVVTPVFKDLKNGQYKMISFWAKRARGLMASYIIRQQISDPSQLVNFDSDGYYYSEEQSNAKQMVFLRDGVPA